MQQLKAGHIACAKRAFFLTFQVIFLWIPRVFSPLSRVFPHLPRVFPHHSRVFPHLSRNKTAASYCRYWIFWPVENPYKGIYKGITKLFTKLRERARPTSNSGRCWQLESRQTQVLNQEFNQSPLLGGKDARYARPPQGRQAALETALGRGFSPSAGGHAAPLSQNGPTARFARLDPPGGCAPRKRPPLLVNQCRKNDRFPCAHFYGKKRNTG